MAQDSQKIPDIYKRDPYAVMDDIIKRWIEAEQAEKAEQAIDVTPAQESHTEAETAVPGPLEDGVDGELA